MSNDLVVTFKDKVELSKGVIERIMEKELTNREWEDVKSDLENHLESIELMDFIWDVMDEIVYDYGQENNFKFDEED